MAECKKTMQSEAAHLNDLAHLCLLNRGDVSTLKYVIMDWHVAIATKTVIRLAK